MPDVCKSDVFHLTLPSLMSFVRNTGWFTTWDPSSSSVNDCPDFFELHRVLSRSRQKNPLDTYKIHEFDSVHMYTSTHSPIACLHKHARQKGRKIVITCKIYSRYRSRTPFPFRASCKRMQSSFSLCD